MMLRDYAAFLAGDHGDSLAADLAATLEKQALPVLRLAFGANVPFERLMAACKDTIETMLAHLEAGTGDAWIAESSRNLTEDRMRGVRQEQLTPPDLLFVLEAQRTLLLRRLPDYTRDPDAVAAIAVEIAELFGRAKLEVFEAYSDIQERLADTIKIAHEQLAEAQSIARIGSWEWDAVADKVAWSDEMYRMWSVDPKTFPGTYQAYLERIHPDDRPQVEQVIRDALAEKSPYVVEHRILHPDGSVRWILGRGRFHQDEGGNVLRIVGVAQDITDRKVSERALAQYAADLEVANANLKDLDRLKDEFLAVVSHELRTPLNFIMGYSSLLEEGIGGDLTADQREYVGRILDGSKRMQRLVDNILQMARMQAGKFDLIFETVDLAPIVQDVLANLGQAAQAKSISLTADDQTADARLVGDSQRLFQVLVNLVENAIKFTGRGGRVAVSVRRAGERFRVEVADTGRGIAARDIPELFKRFRQLDMSATREAGGSGLGLSIAKSLVEAHGGAIGVESTPGVGSTFWFEVPLEPPEELLETVSAESAVSP